MRDNANPQNKPNDQMENKHKHKKENYQKTYADAKHA